MTSDPKNCQEITRLLSEKDDRKLTFLERLMVRIHLYMCAPCENYRDHLALMKKLCAKIQKDNSLVKKASLPDGTRERILKKLSAK